MYISTLLEGKYQISAKQGETLYNNSTKSLLCHYMTDYKTYSLDIWNMIRFYPLESYHPCC